MLLATLLILPLIGAAGIIFLPADRAKWAALVTTLVTFVFSVLVTFRFTGWGSGEFDPQLALSVPWLEAFGISLGFGADAVSMLLVLLTTLLMPLCIWGSFTAVTSRLREYYGWLLLLQAAMTGVFLATDLIFFYVCFEFTLIPMFFLIAIYGGQNRARASIKFFIFTFTGSMITLAGLVYVAWQYALGHDNAWTFDIADLTAYAVGNLSAAQQAWVLLALLSGFAVKVPLFPVHTWLPLAHTEAPTAGSVILAGVLLKLGTYGMFRFVLPMVPDGLIDTVQFTLPLFNSDVSFIPIKLIGVLAIIGVLYAALICWVQNDVKKLVAYSSVSHLGFCVLGLFALNPMGVHGSVLYMLNHGLSTGALFFLIGMIYERYHTRDMRSMSGLAHRMPIWGTFMVFFVLSSVGLPGLNGFVSEFLCLIGAFTASTDAAPYPGMLGPWYAAAAALGMVLAAMYLLIMVGKVVFGPLREPTVHHDDEHESTLPADLTAREIGVLVPLAVLCIYIGFQPSVLMDAMDGSVKSAIAAYPQRFEQIDAPEIVEIVEESPSDSPEMQLEPLPFGIAVDLPFLIQMRSPQ
jgi:NADH-quinone oxidoreductase subunit M